MNEPIKELAEQAKGFVDLNQHVGGDNGCMVYTYDGLERFAELILNQVFICLENSTSINKEYNKALSDLEKTIADRFGVEL
jgi:hypothetical protein